MYGKSIHYHDKIYSAQNKDYAREAAYLLRTIHSYGDYSHASLLDVACGSGEHLRYLKRHFACEGLDIAPELLQLAREKNPELEFHLADMRSFSMGKQCEIITCLFSSIGYLTTHEELITSIQVMQHHLKPGGLLLIEPWFTPDNWKTGHIAMVVINEENFKLVRMSTSATDGAVSCFGMHYLIGTPEGTDHFVEAHRMGFFTRQQMKYAFEHAQMHVDYDEQGPIGRGLYIGKKSGKEKNTV